LRRIVYVCTVLFLFAIVLGVSTSGCVEESAKYSKSTPTTTSQVADLEILEYHDEVDDFGLIHIRGKAKNVGSKALSYAEIRVKFYDVDGALLSTDIDNVNDLGPGEIWNFDVLYTGGEESKVATYKISVGSTW